MRIVSAKTWNSLNERISNLQKTNELLLSRMQMLQSSLDRLQSDSSDIMVMREVTHLLSLSFPVYDQMDYNGETVDTYEFIINDKRTREIMEAVVQQRATNLLNLPK